MSRLFFAICIALALAVPASAYIDTSNTAQAATAKPVRQCSDGIDNDGDTYIDLADPVCAASGPMGKTELPFNQPPAPAKQCANGINDDPAEDTLIDLADPGCTDASDDSELGNPAPPTDGPPPGDGWIFCANEGEFCAFTGTAEVSYGRYSTWTTPRTFTDGTACTNAVFGDPLMGTVKKCYYRPVVVEPPPTGGAFLTGVHWANVSEFQQIKNLGFDYVVKNVPPGDNAFAKQILDEADRVGLKMVIGLYPFGGPNPYTLAADRVTWGMTADARSTINYLETRKASIVAFFGFNEPFWQDPITGADSPCGAVGYESLRNFRTMIRSEWPDAKIWHDTGWPSEWATGGQFHPSCVGTKLDEGANSMDYNGVFFYPFQGLEYQRQQMIDRINKEKAFTAAHMQGVTFSFLGQSMVENTTPWPTHAQLRDQNCVIRSMLGNGEHLSWYVWNQGLYREELVSHPDYAIDLLASAC